MIVINQCKKDKLKQCYISNFTIFEMLKNRDENSRLNVFKKLSKNVFVSQSEMLGSADDMDLFNINIDINLRYRHALLMCYKLATVLGSTCYNVCIIIMYLLLLQKLKRNGHLIDKTVIKKFEGAMTKLAILNREFIKLSDKIGKKFFDLGEKEINVLMIATINRIIDRVNDVIQNDAMHLNHIKKLNTNDAIYINNIKFSLKDVDLVIDEIITYSKYGFITRKLYRMYFHNLFLKSGKFTSNDIIDMNIYFSSIANKTKLITDDDRMKKLIGMDLLIYNPEYIENVC